MITFHARHHSESAERPNWPRTGDSLRTAALATLLGILLVIASREAANALDQLAPPSGSAHSPVDAHVPPALAATPVPPSATRADAGSTQP